MRVSAFPKQVREILPLFTSKALGRPRCPPTQHLETRLGPRFSDDAEDSPGVWLFSFFFSPSGRPAHSCEAVSFPLPKGPRKHKRHLNVTASYLFRRKRPRVYSGLAYI